MDEKSAEDYSLITRDCCGSSTDGGERKMTALELCDDLQLLNKRLQVLEEEASQMRKALVVSMDERREIISDILHLLQTIQTHSSRPETKQPSSTLCQEKRHKTVGLLQALCEDSNPSLVMRVPIRPDAIACLEEDK